MPNTICFGGCSAQTSQSRRETLPKINIGKRIPNFMHTHTQLLTSFRSAKSLQSMYDYIYVYPAACLHIAVYKALIRPHNSGCTSAAST